MPAMKYEARQIEGNEWGVFRGEKLMTLRGPWALDQTKAREMAERWNNDKRLPEAFTRKLGGK